MGRTRSLRAGLVPAALAAVVLGGPGAAGAPAHTRLAASDPGAGAVLSRAPDAVRLRFSEPLTAALSSARVLAPDGRARAGGLGVFRVRPGAPPASTTPRHPPPFLAVLLRWAQFALPAGVIGALAV